MSKEPIDNLPLDGKVEIRWPDREPEIGIYRGYRSGNIRRCAVTLTNGEEEWTCWIDRSILWAMEAKDQ